MSGLKKDREREQVTRLFTKAYQYKLLQVAAICSEGDVHTSDCRHDLKMVLYLEHSSYSSFISVSESLR